MNAETATFAKAYYRTDSQEALLAQNSKQTLRRQTDHMTGRPLIIRHRLQRKS